MTVDQLDRRMKVLSAVTVGRGWDVTCYFRVLWKMSVVFTCAKNARFVSLHDATVRSI